MRPLTIVTGTGRCGSTMLSHALGSHGQVLSLSEFFISLSPLAFPDGVISGVRFWQILAEPRLKANTLVRHGVSFPELRYLDRPGRFEPGRIPAISLIALPSLTVDHDAVYDELAAEVPDWPQAVVADHYRRLFDWLCVRFDRSFVVERSGASLRYVSDLVRLFPEARFVHLYRAGPDCALSMSRHPVFRFIVLLNYIRAYLDVDPFDSPSPEHSDKLPVHLRRFLPDQFDARALRGDEIPLTDFGVLWSHLLAAGIPHLAKLPRHRLLSLSYESILADPEREFARFAHFAGLPGAEDWARSVAPRVDSAKVGGARRLDPALQEELVSACAPGNKMLGYLADGAVADDDTDDTAQAG